MEAKIKDINLIRNHLNQKLNFSTIFSTTPIKHPPFLNYFIKICIHTPIFGAGFLYFLLNKQKHYVL